MSMRDYKFTLQANQERSLNVAGNWFHVLQATGEIEIAFAEGSFNKREQGQGGSRSYDRVTVRSPIQQTVTLALGVGVETDARSSFSGSIEASIEPANIVDPRAEITIAPNQTVLLAAANAIRTELRVAIKSDAENGIYLGNSAVSATSKGGYLEEGSVEYLTTSAAIWGYNDSINSITVNILEMGRS